MKIDIITIFPELFREFFNESLLARAQAKKLLKLSSHNLRDWTTDNHRTVDDRPYGGGVGMVLKIEPIFRAVWALKGKPSASRKTKAHSHAGEKTRVILLSAKGKTFTQKEARRLAKYDRLILICGRYEGVDERVAKYVADEEISIGNYVMFGGEIPAMVVTEAVSRLVPGVIAKPEAVKYESFSDKAAQTREYPQYTRPETFKIKDKKTGKTKLLKVPEILLSGDHQKIADWRKKASK